MKIWRYVIVSLFIASSNSYGQNHQMMNFNILDGLPSSEIYDAVQDDYGYMWFSTDRGISRYNGYEFENFDKSDGLTDNVVFDFLKVKNGDIWCTTLSGGIFRITGVDPTFHPYKYNHLIHKHAKSLTITALYFDENGDVFLRFHHRDGYLRISANGQVLNDTQNNNKGAKFASMVIKDDNSEPFFYNLTPELNNPPPSDSMHFKEQEREKNEALHFANKNTSVFIGDQLDIKSGNHMKTVIPKNDRIIGTGKLDDDHFWIGYNGSGVEVYTYSGEVVQSILPGKFVSQLYRDPQGNTWVCTLNSGVYLQRNTEIKVLDMGSLSDSRGHCIETDPLGNMYFGYYDGSIVQLKSDGKRERIVTPNLSAPALIKYNSYDRDVVYNANNVLRSFQKGVIFEPVESKFLFCEDDSYIVGNRAALTIRNGKVVSHVMRDKRVCDLLSFNNHYFLACSQGLVHYHHKDKSQSNSEILFEGIRMDALEIMGKFLVSASTGHGIYVLDQNFKLVSHITKKDGLSSNFVSNVYTANDSTLWASTNTGINRIRFRGNGPLQISHLDYNDGLLSNEVWDCHVYNDTVWVATQLGINYFAEDYLETNSRPNKKHFLRWKKRFVNNSLEESNGDLELNYYQNKLSFEFEGIDFHEEMEYRYTLKGLENKWNYTSNREIVYTSLPPGRYTLILQGKTSDETWGTNEIRQDFFIHAPFWEAIWFKLLMAAGILFVIYLFFRYRILSYNREILREILRQLLKRLKRKEPPFIIIKSDGREIKIVTDTILFVNSSGNYLDIQCEEAVFVTRMKIGDFLSEVSDPLEFLRVHKSYIIRLDQVEQKSSQKLIIRDFEIPIGRKYRDEVGKINF